MSSNSPNEAGCAPVDSVARERIDANQRVFDAKIKALETALDKFETFTASRFIAGNEFRASLSDVQALMATRRELEAFKDEYRQAHSTLVQAVADLRTAVAVGPADLRGIALQAATEVGRRQGVQGLTANFYTVAGLALAAAALAGHFIH